MKFLFLVRNRMLDLKVNFKGKYTDTLCPCCSLEEDSQQHLLDCSKLTIDGVVVDNLPEYEQLFSEDVTEQIQIARMIKQKFNMRNKLVNQ